MSTANAINDSFQSRSHGNVVDVLNSIAIVGENIAAAIVSPDVDRDDYEAIDLVGAVDGMAKSMKRIADAITPNICGGKDETGGHVESLTEAVMGVTAGLCKIAEAISELASAVREHK